MGQVEEQLALGIAARVDDAAPRGFELSLGEPGVFKRGRLVRVLWIGLRSGEREASELAGLLEAECVRAGLKPEDRPFRAHMTLARARPRDGAPLPDLPRMPGLETWRAAELVLFRSRLGRGGPLYERMRTVSLR